MQFNKTKQEKADVHAHFIGLGVERRKNQVDDFLFQSHQSQSNSQPQTAQQNEPVTPSLLGKEDSLVDGKTNYRLDSVINQQASGSLDLDKTPDVRRV